MSVERSTNGGRLVGTARMMKGPHVSTSVTAEQPSQVGQQKILRGMPTTGKKLGRKTWDIFHRPMPQTFTPSVTLRSDSDNSLHSPRLPLFPFPYARCLRVFRGTVGAQISIRSASICPLPASHRVPSFASWLEPTEFVFKRWRPMFRWPPLQMECSTPFCLCDC